MGNRHYQHLEPIINEYFSLKKMTVSIEAHGSRSGDLWGTDNTVLTGEIKHIFELRRDLPSRFWNDWNSSRSFGGKTSDYKLNDELRLDENQVEKPVLSWIAVIAGQLNHYRRQQNLSRGWLVFEGYDAFSSSLEDAIQLLLSEQHIVSYSLDVFKGVGFCEITFE